MNDYGNLYVFVDQGGLQEHLMEERRKGHLDYETALVYLVSYKEDPKNPVGRIR